MVQPENLFKVLHLPASFLIYLYVHCTYVDTIPISWIEKYNAAETNVHHTYRVII